ncbi:MAG: DUF6077 domain-containing protein [Acetatifactor sp.]
MVIQVLILFLLQVLVPVSAGGIFVRMEEKGSRFLFRWLSGQIILWAGFQIICVPMILKEKSFQTVVILFWIYIGALFLFSVGTRMKHLAERERVTGETRMVFHGSAGILWLIFLFLLLFQLVQTVTLAYGDGDDAFFVAVSTVTESSDKMYKTLAYTGYTTGLDIRHGLAPFPIWISFLARMSGMPPVMTAHLAVAVVMIILGYAAYAMIATQLFGDRRQQLLFLIITEVLVLFGGYSLYTAENFMLARSRQGKAALGSLVIPFIFYLLLYLFKRLDEGKDVYRRYYLLTAATVTAGCLCSTLGALLCCMLIGIAAVVSFFQYKRKKSSVLLVLCCIPGIVYALLYILL